jgi:uncharacterized membrane protein
MPSPHTKKSIYIEAPPRDVYDFALGDLESLPDWMSSVDEVTGHDPSWPAVGSSHTYKRASSKQTLLGTTTVIETTPPNRVVFSETVVVEGDKHPPRGAGKSVWEFVPEGAGTRATLELEGINLSWFLYTLWKWLFRAQTSANVEKSLENLKRICEEELEDAPAE